MIKLGINCSWLLGAQPTAKNYIELAQAAEDRGFNSFWIGDHVVMPTRFEESAYPYGLFNAEAGWPDPYVFLAAISGATKKIMLGTGAAVVPYRAPVPQAQSIATLDHMSDGRFLWGIGIGWMSEEFDVLNVPYKERGARTNEYIRMMKMLWAGDTRPFEGRFFSHAGGLLSPLPVQKPHPPIIVGGEGLPAYKRLIEIGDGLLGNFKPPADFRADLEILNPFLAEHGRDISSELMMMACADIKHILENKEELSELHSLGIKEMYLAPKGSSFKDGMDILDNIARALLV